MTFTTFAEDKVLTKEEVVEMTTLGKTSIYNLMVEGNFPTPVRRGGMLGTRKGWRRSEVLEWIYARAVLRDCGEGSIRKDPRLLKMTEVEALTGLGRSQIYLLMQSGAFPEGVTLKRHRKAWLASEVEAFMRFRDARRERKQNRENELADAHSA